MASGNSADSFLDLLRQSGLVPDDQMLALREEYSGERAKPDGSRELADELVKREILTRWQADMLLKGKHRGFRLGPHRILRPLGQGGMSKVFLAEHEMMRRRCAIKVLPSKYQADPDLLARFHIEARAIAALDHPHIVRAYDFNKDVRYGKEIHYLVMEYVDGPDLRRLVDEQGPLDFRKAADFIGQAADGLAHAHQAGFVHRDIKPANLLVDQNGVLKILDLGLARVTFEGEQPWQTSEGEPSAVGTADYVAPEQVADSRNVDGRADIYGLGHTFYFLLTGRRPFPKSTLVELLMAHRREQPEPIGKFRPDVPLELIEIIERMTAKEPVRRFQTAREVADKIQAWLNESAGGGDYSRISALMAAAMRSRQPSEQDSAKARPKEAEASVLELAALEDEPRPPAKPNIADGQKVETTKPSPAKEQPPSLKQSAHGDSKPSLANLRADVLAELLPGDSISASQSDPLMMLPADEGRLQYPTSPRFKRQGGLLVILKSPWFWTALVWLVFAVLLLFLLFGSPSSDKPREQRPVGSVKRNGSDTPAELPASPAPSRRMPDEEQTETPPSPPPDDTPSPEAAEPSPSPIETPPSQPAEEPAPEPPTTPVEPATPKPETDETQPKPVIPPATKTISASELLAGIEKLSLQFRSSDRDPKSTLNLTIRRQALDAVKQLGIEVEEKDPPVMIIDIKASTTADLFTVVISADVGCPIPDGRLARVWTQSKQVVSIPSQRLRQDQVLRMLRIGAKDFFDRFVDDVRKARVKAKFK
ncbi:MAG: serine/threonine protein kinase [Planctomycetes bacterium]|nr:serine/threonine protein kinase [Planctomycetota bacterium]MBU4400181.1 serine/threonine protein kinase [Planctomycetota bacterium]MCG2684351.1 serine/threonine protein kinase [Planctomycetales bacterium]